MWFDLTLAGLLVAFALVEALAAEGNRTRLVVATVLQAGSVAVRRLAPLAAATVLVSGLVLEHAGHHVDTGNAGLVALLVLLYSLGRFADRRDRRYGLAVMGVGILAVVVAEAGESSLGEWMSDLVVIVLTSAGAAGVGIALRHRSELKHDVDLIEQAWGEREKAVVIEERQRIARELHDVVGHALAGITLTAGGAEQIPGSPDPVLDALVRIRTSSQQAAAEMRRLVGLLRTQADTVELTPQPTLESLELLVGGARDSGVDVAFEVRGSPVATPPGLQLALYRVVQEGLTNAMHHAQGAPVRVALTWTPVSVAVEVVDSGPGEARALRSEGHGLIGLRERVQLYGGRFEARPDAEGGFRLVATLPVP